MFISKGGPDNSLCVYHTHHKGKEADREMPFRVSKGMFGLFSLMLSTCRRPLTIKGDLCGKPVGVQPMVQTG